jgi:hypothetical protein
MDRPRPGITPNASLRSPSSGCWRSVSLTSIRITPRPPRVARDPHPRPGLRAPRSRSSSFRAVPASPTTSSTRPSQVPSAIAATSPWSGTARCRGIRRAVLPRGGPDLFQASTDLIGEASPERHVERRHPHRVDLRRAASREHPPLRDAPRQPRRATSCGTRRRPTTSFATRPSCARRTPPAASAPTTGGDDARPGRRHVGSLAVPADQRPATGVIDAPYAEESAPAVIPGRSSATSPPTSHPWVDSWRRRGRRREGRGRNDDRVSPVSACCSCCGCRCTSADEAASDARWAPCTGAPRLLLLGLGGWCSRLWRSWPSRRPSRSAPGG